MFDPLAVQGTLKSFPAPTKFKTVDSLLLNLLWSNPHPYITTRKAIALTRQTFVGKVVSLLFNALSSFVIAFLPRSKCLNVSADSDCGTILKSKKIKSDTVSLFPPYICHEIMGPDAMILVF